MVKSVLGVNHQGLTDWVIQRASAILMAVYSIWLIGYMVCHPGMTYGEWHHLFSLVSMKIATILFIVAILFHAWIGIWTIFTDYVKCYVLRCVLNSLVILTLAACFVWAVMILWSV